ncbi:PspC domain-containing protein [Xanthomarina sp. F1114]|uniref:PspC domain-containing protein n=1 Tax=Xanthomarina sp. F1114 TaxID=2996019 RepID=UPI00225E508A|nr:PspC domain-containing protein [Xanthomarina sp. F1114]MCX7547241.1 PspC domain-containing protein [Xanthomarina sp. F1114]
MNKTVNINLAGIFFHIDEDAYLKLQRYLEAIKRSFTDSQGRSEIIADIEARIAELFSERVKHDKHVIGNKEVDEVITIMGQPEDYLVDDEIFEDEPKSHYQSRHSGASKKLFRDPDNSYIGGVASGLGYYLGIDSLWVRLLWILLALGSGGTFIFIYILFWILVPEALTTADKLTMTGEPVNISNIEKKIKDGFENVTQTVSDTVKNIDVSKQSNKIKSSSKSFFDTIGDIVMFFLNIIAKFIGILLIVTGASVLIGLIIGFFTVGVADIIKVPGIDFLDAANAANTPLWLMSLLLFFAIGIPFFFLFYLGLKILINNLKSIGNIAKFSLLGIWLLALISLSVIGIKQASEHAFDASITKKTELNITANDTLKIKMYGNNSYEKHTRRSSEFKLVYNDKDEKIIFSSNVRLIVRSTKDSLAYIQIEKSAEGSSYKQAKERATNINYNYNLRNKELKLDYYLTTEYKNKFSDQEIEIILYLPEGTTLVADENTSSYHSNSSRYNDILEQGMEGYFLKIMDNSMYCLDCPDGFNLDIDVNKKKSKVKINNEGIDIKSNDSSLEINHKGVKAKSESVRVDIDENGINITSDGN